MKTDGAQWQIQKLVTEKKGHLSEQISLDHYFARFSFEPADGSQDLEEIKRRFKEHPDHLKFDLTEEAQYQAMKVAQTMAPSEKVYNYFKFCKLVPHIFLDSTEGGHEKDYETWSYSLTQNSKEASSNLVLNI